MTSERMDFESPRPNDRGAVPDGGRTVKRVTVISTSDTPELSALHRNTFEQLPIGIAYASRDGRFIWTNQAFCSLLQLTARELAGLVRNAKYACDESGRPDKEVCVRVENTGTTVRISVIDNGVGIKPEHRNQLFSHGFTTRQSGHGFGLHSAALAAAEFGGTLSAHSDGDGCGATFVLDLPLAAVDSAR